MFIFSEDPPLKEKGHGLSVLLYNLFNDSGIPIEKWFTFLSNKNVSAKDIQKDINVPFRILDITASFKLVRKSARINNLYNEFLFFFFLPVILTDFRKHASKPIFFPIGASAHILFKIYLINIFAKNPIWIYIVDDLEEISATQNQRLNKLLCKIFLKKCFRSSQQIFAITNNLAEKISHSTGMSVKIILPCFQKIASVKKNETFQTGRKFTFVFTGGLNFLYNDSLKLFSDFLKRLQSDLNREFSLIVQTYSRKEDFDKIEFNNSMVEYRTSENREDLYLTYAEADAFIVPYSFDIQNRSMVSTSFPQKIAQIIQLGIPIVVFGPSYGSVIRFFQDKNLDYVINEPDYVFFKPIILQLINAAVLNDENKSYLDVYATNFSQEACLSNLNKDLV